MSKLDKKQKINVEIEAVRSRDSIFMLVGILGVAVGVIFTYYGKFSLNYGVVVTLFFAIMFVAGLISITPE